MKLLLLLIIASVPLFSETSPDVKDRTFMESIDQERLDILKYGIDSEVLEVLGEIQDEKDTTLIPEITKILESSENQNILQSVFKLYMTLENQEAIEKAVFILKNEELYNPTMIVTVLRYLSEVEYSDDEDLVYSMLFSPGSLISQTAASALGATAGKETAEKILNLLQDDEDLASETRLNLIHSLGLLKYELAADYFSEILENEDFPVMERRNAAWSLSYLGNEENIDFLIDMTSDSDAHLRANIYENLHLYKNDETNTILLNGLRDSFWEIRISCIQALGRKKMKDSVPALIYKAKKDPEKKVRKAAYMALGEIGSSKAMDFLKEILLSESSYQAQKEYALESLLDNDLYGSEATIKKLIEKEWGEEDSKILAFTAKQISLINAPFLGPFYEKFLSHENYLLRILALQGIKLNKMKSLKSIVEKHADKDSETDGRVRRLAESVLAVF